MSSTSTILQANLLTRLGRPSTDPLLASATLVLELNYAAHFFASEYPWPWLQTSENIATTTGTDTYVTAAAATYIDTVSLRIAGSPPLIRMSKAELDRQWPVAVSGTPLFYATHLISSIVVRPVPITTVLPTLIHVYHKAETALAAGGDTFLVPVWWEQAVIEKAAAELFYRVNDRARGDNAMQRYETVRNRALEFVRRAQEQSDGNDLVPAQPLAPLPGKSTAA
jgi:hypothetical protein